MARRFQYRLSSLFWLAAIVAINCVTLPPVYHESIFLLNRKPAAKPRLRAVFTDRISINGDSSDFFLPLEHEESELSVTEWPELTLPEWEPMELIYLNDDGTATVEHVERDRL